MPLYLQCMKRTQIFHNEYTSQIYTHEYTHTCPRQRDTYTTCTYTYTSYFVWTVTQSESSIPMSLVAFWRNVATETQGTRSFIEIRDWSIDTPNATSCTYECVERTERFHSMCRPIIYIHTHMPWDRTQIRFYNNGVSCDRWVLAFRWTWSVSPQALG